MKISNDGKLTKKECQVLRRVLNDLDQMFAKATTSRDLWDILSALRGPDNDDVVLKNDTTAFIRTWAFPRTAMSMDCPAIFRGVDYLTEKQMQALAYPSEYGLGENDHFLGHIRNAARVLQQVRPFKAPKPQKPKR
jgi:hypothetical protein